MSRREQLLAEASKRGLLNGKAKPAPEPPEPPEPLKPDLAALAQEFLAEEALREQADSARIELSVAPMREQLELSLQHSLTMQEGVRELVGVLAKQGTPHLHLPEQIGPLELSIPVPHVTNEISVPKQAPPVVNVEIDMKPVADAVSSLKELFTTLTKLVETTEKRLAASEKSEETLAASCVKLVEKCSAIIEKQQGQKPAAPVVHVSVPKQEAPNVTVNMPKVKATNHKRDRDTGHIARTEYEYE